MARIAGVTLPKNKRIEVALTYIFGVGLKSSQDILKETKIDVNTRTKDLTEAEVNALKNAIETGEKLVEGDLRRDIATNIKRHIDISSYRGDRHKKKLPVRGQRTKTNSRTVHGNKRRTMGSGRRDAAQKT